MDGIILINKQKNYTSHDVVSVVKSKLNEKVGHTGTLDPMAKGVLPLLIGKATQISKYLVNHDKTYEAVLKLGIKTDTADGTGNIVDKQEINMPKKDEIEEAFCSMVGKLEEIPPMYSAIKVNGKKLYEYARKGQEVKVEPRQIEIYSLTLNNINEQEKEITYTVECSKGTYIRTLCEQIADKLGTIGYMKELNRTRVGNFKIEDTILLDMLKENREEAIKHIISIEEFFKDKEEIVLGKEQLEKFLNGVKLPCKLEDNVCRIYNKAQEFIGLGIIQNGFVKRDVIL